VAGAADLEENQALTLELDFLSSSFRDSTIVR
jgi:hypothetical protein